MNRKRDYDIPDVTHKDLISCDWACAWTGGAGCSATLLLPSYLLCQRREGFRVQKQNKNWQMFWFASLPKNECSWTPNSSLFISRRASRWKPKKQPAFAHGEHFTALIFRTLEKAPQLFLPSWIIAGCWLSRERTALRSLASLVQHLILP